MQVNSTQRSNLDNLLGWWYRFTAPPEVPASAPLREREAVRIGKLTSATLLFEIIYITIVIGVAFTNNPHLLPVLIANYVMTAIGIVCNRFYRTSLAAIVAFSTIEIGMFYNIFSLSMAGLLGSYNLPLFDILVIPELIAASLFPAWFVLPVAFFNCLGIMASLIFLPKTPELTHALAIASYNIYERPIAIQVITAFVSYLWISSAIQGMRRADNAEEMNNLAQELLIQQRSKVQEKQKLEESIQQIIEVHMRVANGNFNARVPLNDSNMLWPLAGSLNNLLGRVQRWRQDAIQSERMHLAIHKLTQDIRAAQQQGLPFQLLKTGTDLDPLLTELNPLLMANTQPTNSNEQFNTPIPNSRPRWGEQVFQMHPYMEDHR
jgi:hypothetical protein